MTETMWVDLASGLMAKTGSASHTGSYRENNEDFVHVDSDYPFALVLDGMGGMAAGELASQRGAEAVRDVLRSGLDHAKEPRALIERALHAGQEAVLELSRSNRQYRGCGTTIVLALVHGGSVYISWLGDSPAFRVSDGRIEKLTWEHDLRTAMIRHGIIPANEVNDYRIGNILCKYLGSPSGLEDRNPQGSSSTGAEEQIEIPSFKPQHGDRLLLVTDGITSVLSEKQILEVCGFYSDPHDCANELVRCALDSGSRDNCTCAVIAFERESGASPPKVPPQPVRKWWQFFFPSRNPG